MINTRAQLLLAALAGGLLSGLIAGLWAQAERGRAEASVQACRADMASLRTAHAETGRLAAQAHAAELQRAAAHADALTLRLSAQLSHAARLEAQHRAQIARLTDGRACLRPDAVGLLNADARPAAGPDMPAPPGTAGSTHAPEFAALAGDGEDAQAWASDADIADWIVTARGLYSACAARLDALIDWHATDSSPDHRQP